MRLMFLAQSGSEKIVGLVKDDVVFGNEENKICLKQASFLKQSLMLEKEIDKEKEIKRKEKNDMKIPNSLRIFSLRNCLKIFTDK